MSTSLQIQCLEAVKATIVALGLPGLPAAQVYAKKVPTDRKITLPAIVCSLPPNESELMVGGLNAREDVGYPVMVTFLKAANADMEIGAGEDEYSLWREQVALRFHNQRIDNVGRVYMAKVEPRQILDFDAFINRNTYAGALLVRCIARLPRVAGSPLSIANLAAWYWAAARGFKDTGAVTALAADADGVALRQDLSGNARHQSQATAGAQAAWKVNQQNGYPCDQFDGVNDILSYTGAGLGQPAWEFVAFKLLSAAPTNQTVIDGAGQNQSRIYVASNSAGINTNAGAGGVGDVLSVQTNTMYIAAARFNGASSSLQINNRAQVTGNAGANAVTGLQSGGDATQFGNVQIFERARYQRDLTQSEADFVRNLFNTRYGAW